MADYDTEAEAPLDPAAERLRRKLLRLLLGSGLIMMLGLIAVFTAVVYKTGLLGSDAGRRTPAAQVTAEAEIAVPPGARLVSADLDAAQALLTFDSAEGTTLLLVDLASGAVVGRYPIVER